MEGKRSFKDVDMGIQSLPLIGRDFKGLDFKKMMQQGGDISKCPFFKNQKKDGEHEGTMA